MGNKRPLTQSVLKSRINELSKFGLSFHELLDKIVEEGTSESVLSHLDKLSLKDDVLKLHVASEKPHDIGDESYFYIGKIILLHR
ncbi:hypothetical protein [Sangeribacter muris]|jgi:hypothetical protein|uniref:hypothetical protein n=1 Tax=Sangeribacter muris TaxID=2880703 RepID=UPI00244E1EAD|nr:hypothetical protein [Sangeribacter muris]